MLTPDKMKDIRILIVDDMPQNINLLGTILKQDGYNIIAATNGKLALKAAMSKHPDLILLDIHMPDMDGYTVCQHLKSEDITRQIPIIFITARNQPEDVVRGFDVGGADYISKPFYPNTLLARVKVHLERALLSRQTQEQNQQLSAANYELNLLNQKLSQQYAEIQKFQLNVMEELKVGEAVQRLILPTRSFSFPNLLTEHLYYPLNVISGDFFDFIPLDEHRLLVVIADVTGHGIPAALYTMMIKAFMIYIIRQFQTPAAILTALNQHIMRMLFEGFLIPVTVALIDLKKNLLSFSNAGNPYPLLYQNLQIYSLQANNLLLGIDPDYQFMEDSIPFNPGDRLLLFSDGIYSYTHFQTKNTVGNINQIIQQILIQNPLVSCQQIYETIGKSYPNSKIEDDIVLTSLIHKKS